MLGPLRSVALYTRNKVRAEELEDKIAKSCRERARFSNPKMVRLVVMCLRLDAEGKG
jgi:hypothetical protein